MPLFSTNKISKTKQKMTNTNKTFYTILSLSAPRLINGSYNIIASSHYLGFMDDKFNPSILAKRLKMVYDSSLKFVNINNDITKFSISKVGDSFSKDFTILNFSNELFFTTDNLAHILIKNKNINQFIFMFKDRDYGELVANLALFNIIVSVGSNTKKHILSPIQLRLARFLIALLSGGGSDVANSFHSDRIKGRAKVDFTTNEVKEKRLKHLALIDKENKEAEANYKETSLKTEPSLDDKDKSKGGGIEKK
jgi:hypothetical protein